MLLALFNNRPIADDLIDPLMIFSYSLSVVL
jgi:hypothetical protein